MLNVMYCAPSQTDLWLQFTFSLQFTFAHDPALDLFSKFLKPFCLSNNTHISFWNHLFVQIFVNQVFPFDWFTRKEICIPPGGNVVNYSRGIRMLGGGAIGCARCVKSLKFHNTQWNFHCLHQVICILTKKLEFF